MVLDKDTVLKVMPLAPIENATALALAVSKYGAAMGILTPNALAIFLGNVAHESNQLRDLKEKGSNAYLTGKAYYPYIGVGPIQVTGKSNYNAVSQYLYGDDRLVKKPSLILQDKNALMVASLYWWFINRKILNKYADAGNATAVSNYVNRGSVTKTALKLQERLDYVSKAIQAMKKKIYNVRFKNAVTYTSIPLWNYLILFAKSKK